MVDVLKLRAPFCFSGAIFAVDFGASSCQHIKSKPLDRSSPIPNRCHTMTARDGSVACSRVDKTQAVTKAKCSR